MISAERKLIRSILKNGFQRVSTIINTLYLIDKKKKKLEKSCFFWLKKANITLNKIIKEDNQVTGA